MGWWSLTNRYPLTERTSNSSLRRWKFDPGSRGGLLSPFHWSTWIATWWNVLNCLPLALFPKWNHVFMSWLMAKINWNNPKQRVVCHSACKFMIVVSCCSSHFAEQPCDNVWLCSSCWYTSSNPIKPGFVLVVHIVIGLTLLAATCSYFNTWKLDWCLKILEVHVQPMIAFESSLFSCA